MKNNIEKCIFLVLALMVASLAPISLVWAADTTGIVKPTVHIISPAEHSTVKGAVSVEADVSGPAEHVRFAIRDKDTYAKSGTSVISDKVGPGRHTVVL